MMNKKRSRIHFANPAEVIQLAGPLCRPQASHSGTISATCSLGRLSQLIHLKMDRLETTFIEGLFSGASF